VQLSFNTIPANGTFNAEYRWRHADGEYRWFQEQAVALRGEQSDTVEIVGAIVDITERKKASRSCERPPNA